MVLLVSSESQQKQQELDSPIMQPDSSSVNPNDRPT